MKFNLFHRTKEEMPDRHEKLLSADDAFRATCNPQIRKAIENINNNIAEGNQTCYICDRNKPHEILLSLLISKGYDIHITTWAHSKGEYFTEVTFDGEASGRLTFENDTTKKLFKDYSIVDMDNNGDIYKTMP